MNRLFWSTSISGLCVLFVGIGLCRFAYTPLIPSLVAQGWLSISGAGYVGAGNLLGYLFAVYLGHYSLRYFSLGQIIKFSLLLSIVSLALCAIHLGLAWLTVWRFFAGVSGALLMIMSPAVILKNMPSSHKGRAAGIMFSGIGFGIIVSGSVLPYFAAKNNAMAWIGAMVLAIIASVFAWKTFNSDDSTTKLGKDKAGQKKRPIEDKQSKEDFFLLSCAYLAYGIGMVPHTLFLVAYVNNNFKLNIVMSGMFWSLFGIGATMGPFCNGILADKIGYKKSLIGAFLMACLGVLSLVLGTNSMLLSLVSSLIMGMMLSSIPSLVSARVLELVGLEQHPHYWGHATLYCAISQAIAAYAMAYFLHHAYPYLDLFILAGIVFFVGLITLLYQGKKSYEFGDETSPGMSTKI